MKKHSILTIIFSFILGFSMNAQEYIKVKGNRFIKDGQTYQYIGTNFWYGMNLGAYDKERLHEELDQLKKIGVTNLRIMAGSEGAASDPWRMQPCLQDKPNHFNEELLEGLDYLLNEMKERDMVGVLCLNNFWPWSGGFSQYVSWANEDESIPYPPPAEGGDWRTYQEYSAKFYTSEKALTLFNNFVKKIVTRTNSVNNTKYTNDPTIMAWQLANEPEGVNQSDQYRDWLHNTSKYIKKLDKNHLVSIGSEGNTPSKKTGNDFEKDHLLKHIDYCTFHLWIQNWGWYDPMNPEKSYDEAIATADRYLDEHFEIAKKIGKPVVLEEFGISRDYNDYNAEAPTMYRDAYYEYIFTKVLKETTEGVAAGANFWAWGGKGRPRTPKAVWKTGDDFIGDPPHEFQGWYSVYNTDKSTIAIIKEYCEKMISQE